MSERCGNETAVDEGTFGWLCRERRHELGLTQRDVAIRAGVDSNMYVSLLEHGRLSPASAKGSAICSFLGVPAEAQDVDGAVKGWPGAKAWSRDLARAMDARGLTCAAAAELSGAPSASMVGYLLKGKLSDPDVPWARRLCRELGVPALQDWTEARSLDAQTEALAALAGADGPGRTGPGVTSPALVHALRRQAGRLGVTPSQAAAMAGVPESQAEELLERGTCPAMTLGSLNDLASALGVRVELSADGPRDPEPAWWEDEDLDYALLWMSDAGVRPLGFADLGDLARALGIEPAQLRERLSDLGIDPGALLDAACDEAMAQVDWPRAVGDAVRRSAIGPRTRRACRVWTADDPEVRLAALRALSVDPGAPAAPRPRKGGARLSWDTEELDAGPFVLRREVATAEAGPDGSTGGLEALAGEGPWRLEYRTALDAACSRTDAVRFTMDRSGGLEVRLDGDEPRLPRMAMDDLLSVYKGWGWRVPEAEPVRRVAEADRARLARLLDRYHDRDARRVPLASGGTLAGALPCDAVALLEALDGAEAAAGAP